jgi:hypothetical protein
MMSDGSSTPGVGNRMQRRIALSIACAVALLCPSLAVTAGAMGRAAGPSERSAALPLTPAPSASVILEQCVTAVLQSERSATFSAEMTAISGSARMGMQINIQAQMPGEALFHTISAPGLGAWRSSGPGVKTYKYLKQVTNLTAPAVYRGAVRFRWLNAKGHVIKDIERNTARCEQPDLLGVAPSTSSLAGRPLE